MHIFSTLFGDFIVPVSESLGATSVQNILSKLRFSSVYVKKFESGSQCRRDEVRQRSTSGNIRNSVKNYPKHWAIYKETLGDIRRHQGGGW